MEHYDFVIIGAGISGVDAAYRLKTQLPDASYTILEARDVVGGTWSFFNFPGLRSDSQLTSFGLPWRPWMHQKDIANAALIREYIQSAARDEGIDAKIQFNTKVTAASWSSDEQQWTLSAASAGAEKTVRATFVLACCGYYRYDKPLETIIPGIKDFRGTVAHPQTWPESLDWAGKKVVVVGSGATAITIVPEMAKTAGHLTMLQRSPSYVLSVPSVNPDGKILKRFLPAWLAFPIYWWRCVIEEHLFVLFSLCFPRLSRKLLIWLARRELPSSVDVDVHFNPRYLPFEQRLCLCPDGDFFKAFHRDNCDIVTDSIDKVVADGIITKSGQKIDADIIVTATGLHVQLLGGLAPTVDGKPFVIGECYGWRGAMLTGLPNMGAVFGYTTTSWTLGADASVRLLIQVYKHMKQVGATSAVPVLDEAGRAAPSKPVISHSSTYFVLAKDRLPKVTDQAPYSGRIHAIYDNWMLWFGNVTRGMEYTIPSKKRL
ncbi:monooxygenase [Microdochium bolleyi]|uniref:Monooxygenase n=1 Tax=Microdochium bolleyi TaxID=196109 RepID=A0A136JGB8_9PEZI|nr:monooxygenase [Microdochium bolleyi]